MFFLLVIHNECAIFIQINRNINSATETKYCRIHIISNLDYSIFTMASIIFFEDILA